MVSSLTDVQLASVQTPGVWDAPCLLCCTSCGGGHYGQLRGEGGEQAWGECSTMSKACYIYLVMFIEKWVISPKHRPLPLRIHPPKLWPDSRRLLTFSAAPGTRCADDHKTRAVRREEQTYSRSPSRGFRRTSDGSIRPGGALDSSEETNAIDAMNWRSRLYHDPLVKGFCRVPMHLLYAQSSSERVPRRRQSGDEGTCEWSSWSTKGQML
jgi:hypothetical protein